MVFGYYGFIVRCYTEFSVGIIGGKEMPVSKGKKVKVGEKCFQVTKY